jgi:phage gp29-like protein
MAERPIVNKEIATTGDGMDITYPYVWDLLQTRDPILLDKGQGDLELYEKIMTDDQVYAAMQQRRDAVISCEWIVDPGDDRRLSKKASEFIKEQLNHIHWDDVTKKMLLGVYYGYAVGECLWMRDGSQIVLDAVKVKKQKRFAFDKESRLRLLTIENPLGMELPERKFWWFSTGADNHDDPYGLGLAHYLYWLVLFKRGGMRFWLNFLERFAQPVPHGTYPPETPDEEQKKLLKALQALVRDGGVITPEGMKIDFLEAKRSGTADYSTLLDKMNAAISKVVLSQTMTTDDGSSYSQAKVHQGVKLEVIKADADLICNSFNRSIARWLTEWNFPGAEPPRVWRRVEVEANLKELAERDKIIFEMGYRPNLDYIQETYDQRFELAPAPKPPSLRLIQGGDQQQPQPEFKEPEQIRQGEIYQALQVLFAEREPDNADQIASRLGTESNALVREWLKEIQGELENTGDLNQFAERILAMYPGLPSDKLVEVMSNGLTAAGMAGWLEAKA